MKNKQSTQKKHQTQHKTESSRKGEIDLSTLTSAQKQMCLKLLAQNDIKFDEQNGGFSAELRIDPRKLTSQFQTSEKKKEQTSLTLSPIKKRLPLAERNCRAQGKPKAKDQPKEKQAANSKAVAKRKVLNIYSSCKKPLSKTVKIDFLKRLQELHPEVELYVYPKKMSLETLNQIIEQIYEGYWKQKQSRSRHQGKGFKGQGQETSSVPSFCDWVYEKYICSPFSENSLCSNPKNRTQQTLANFIESINHFSYKQVGIQIFYNFLAGVYSMDCLHYFLVIRTLLQQIYKETILQRVPDYSSRPGYSYRLKINPLEKVVEQKVVYEFLQVCCCTGESQTDQSEHDNAEVVFQKMTEKMYFDQNKKKNYIYYFDMCQILLSQFQHEENSKTHQNSQSSCQQKETRNARPLYGNIHNESLNEFLLQSHQRQKQDQFDQNQELKLEFNVYEAGKNQEESTQKELMHYLPEDSLRENDSQGSFEQQFLEAVNSKFKKIHCSLGLTEISNDAESLILALLKSVFENDKKLWIIALGEYCQKSGKPVLSSKKQEKELLYVETLQKRYREAEEAKFVSNQLIKKILTASFVRQAIAAESCTFKMNSD